MDDKCPFCGAEKGKYSLKNQWMCSSFWIPSTMTYMQSSECKDHQIANLTASRDRWKELFEAYSEYGMGTYFTSDGEAEVKKAVAALKSAGEWED